MPRCKPQLLFQRENKFKQTKRNRRNNKQASANRQKCLHKPRSLRLQRRPSSPIENVEACSTEGPFQSFRHPGYQNHDAWSAWCRTLSAVFLDAPSAHISRSDFPRSTRRRFSVTIFFAFCLFFIFQFLHWRASHGTALVARVKRSTPETLVTWMMPLTQVIKQYFSNLASIKL